jgi:hypothetical protein
MMFKAAEAVVGVELSSEMPFLVVEYEKRILP